MTLLDLPTLLFVWIVLTIYFVPTLVAWQRVHHQQEAIFVLNLLLGWAGLGWILALVWAYTQVQPRVVVQRSAVRSFAALTGWAVLVGIGLGLCFVKWQPRPSVLTTRALIIPTEHEVTRQNGQALICQKAGDDWNGLCDWRTLSVFPPKPGQRYVCVKDSKHQGVTCSWK